MTITLRLHDGRVRTARVPYPGADYVVVEGARCECSPDVPLQAQGGDVTRHGHGHQLTAPAGCSRCHGAVGTLTVQYDTLFGPDEDRAVLCGRPRVY